MNDVEILTKAIEKAERNGFSHPNWLYENYAGQMAGELLDSYMEDVLLFNHKFASTFFGEEMVCQICGTKCEAYTHCCTDNNIILMNYEYHLQKIVLIPEHERLQYLEKFL